LGRIFRSGSIELRCRVICVGGPNIVSCRVATSQQCDVCH